MVSDKKNDNANPHKVFHWPDGSASGGEDPPFGPLLYWIPDKLKRGDKLY